MSSFTIADLQKLNEMEPISKYFEGGLAQCHRSCTLTCTFTCGPLTCGRTVGAQEVAGAGASGEVAARRALPDAWDVDRSVGEPEELSTEERRPRSGRGIEEGRKEQRRREGSGRKQK